jgi:hypothetical protein
MNLTLDALGSKRRLMRFADGKGLPKMAQILVQLLSVKVILP